MGYEGYTFRFKNQETKDYYDYEKDNFMSQTFERIQEAGYTEEAKEYLYKHLLEGEQ